MMNATRLGSGNYTLDIIEGKLRLVFISDKRLERLKLGDGEGDKESLILSAEYNIHEGILYLKGDVTVVEKLYGGEYGMYDFNNQSEIDDKIKKYYIEPRLVFTETVERWFKPDYEKRYIRRGWYLRKETVPRTY